MRKFLLFALMLSGMISSAQITITNSSCKAQFKYEVNTQVMTLLPATAINFYDRSEGKVIAWFWDFGDGNTSQEQNPMFVFNHPLEGSTVKMSPYRTVSLTIFTADSCKSFYSETINIMDSNPSATPDCKAEFKYYQTAYDSIGGTASFQLTNLSEGDSLKYQWQFDNGKTSTEKEPTVTFDLKQNERKVCLTVSGKNNCMDTFCAPIYVLNTEKPVIEPAQCKTYFKYSVNYNIKTLLPALVLDFHPEASPDAVEWKWDFDNGETSSEANPTHIFNLPLAKDSIPGDPNPFRKVCLTVKTATGCVASYCETINIYMDTTSPANPDDSTQCFTAYGYTVNYTIKTFAPALVLDFYSKASPGASEWTWDFGDGTTSAEENPTHIFNFPLGNDSISGNSNPFKKVCLTVKTASGCMASYCETINIYMNTTKPVDPGQQCHAWFKYDRATDVISIPEVVPYRLMDASEGKVIRRLWQFEDGTTNTEAQPLVNFDFLKHTQKVCLTIHTADSCSSTWCETIYVSPMEPDTTFTSNSTDGYSMHYASSFPIYMSSCAGYAKAQVYLKDSPVNAVDYVWSNGAEGQEVKGLCPTQTYSVKAKAPDGTIVSGTFVFNSIGSVSEIATNSWAPEVKNNSYISYNLNNKDYTVEWRLCDGNIVKSDSIPVNLINCGSNESNLILKDASGNVVYSENVLLKTTTTGIDPALNTSTSSVKLFPNPVNDVLNILYAGNSLNEMQIEIFDITGKSVSLQKLNNIESGQNIALNVSLLRRGVYLCKLFTKKQIIAAEKFVK